MKSTATLILNRNLPETTNALYESLVRHDGDETDVYVIESGSSPENLSCYCSFWADWEDSVANGLRYPRGFNFGLAELWRSGRFGDYEFFFLVCNDCVFDDRPVVRTLVDEMRRHPRLGILSPCSEAWGERKLLRPGETKYFWYVNHVAWLLRREYVEALMEPDQPSHMNFLYDGENFRGYESDIELIVKGYANDWAAGITTRARVEENADLLKTQFERMRTDEYHVNRERVVAEGKRWLRRKYGFNSRWTMQMYAKFFYDKFFEFYPQLAHYRI
jgi:hypothetical protein